MKVFSPPVLYFHSVAQGRLEPWTLSFLTLELSRFEDQMRYFQERSYRSLFLDEWLEARQGKRKAAEGEICITFDDGLLDNWVYAFPVARKYGMRLTLFVCPELIDPRDIVRPNLDDVWAGRCAPSDLNALGNLSWNELRLMEASGLVDVQSHTMSHAKYFASDKLRGFYYGGFPGFYPAQNTYDAASKPFYMNDPDFERRIPAGMPLFEETSSVTARKHTINPDFFSETVELARNFNLSDPDNRPAYEEKAGEIYRRYLQNQSLVAGIETEDEQRERRLYEIAESKKILESRLGKTISFLCWPHGDNDSACHEMAREAGYLATSLGKMPDEKNRPDRIPRFSTDWNASPWIARQKLHYKLSSHYEKQPYYAVWLANEWKNKVLSSLK